MWPFHPHVVFPQSDPSAEWSLPHHIMPRKEEEEDSSIIHWLVLSVDFPVGGVWFSLTYFPSLPPAQTYSLMSFLLMPGHMSFPLAF